MNVVLTGCAGFIGARVCGMLLERGDRVVGIDNLNNAYDPELKKRRLAEFDGYDNFFFRKADISDSAQVERVFSDPPGGFSPVAVIALAARAGVRDSLRIPDVYFRTNVLGTLNLLNACLRYNVAKFVFASSSSVYGDGALPFTEYKSAIDRPLSPYAASKMSGEGLCHSYHKAFGTDVSIMRYFTVYGPAGRPDMSIFRFVRAVAEGSELTLYGTGSQKRDFTFVDDAARATVLALGDVGFEPFNIAGGNSVILSDIIKMIENFAGKKAVIANRDANPADSEATEASITKAKSLLGWEPLVDIESGIERCARWYMENKDWARLIGAADV